MCTSLTCPIAPVPPAPDESAATTNDASLGSLPAPRRGVPVWLVLVTLASLALFVAGLVAFLGREAPAVAASTGSGATAGAPAGMIRVYHPDGTPWFDVDAHPVSAAAFQAVFGNHVQPGAPSDPAIDVTYEDAIAYAKAMTHGGRLLRADEWEAAIKAPGFVHPPGVFEWVESPAQKRAVRPAGKPAVTDNPQSDVSFRVAKDL